MTDIYENPAEEALHRGAIAALAEELQLDADAIRQVYESHYLRLRPAARVRDYLSVLVSRRARDALRRRG